METFDNFFCDVTGQSHKVFQKYFLLHDATYFFPNLTKFSVILPHKSIIVWYKIFPIN